MPVPPTGPKAKATEPRAQHPRVPATADPKVGEVVKIYLKAIGGGDALRAIKDCHMKLEIIRPTVTGNTTVIFDRYLKQPHMAREDWHGAWTFVYNGKMGKAWMKMKMGPGLTPRGANRSFQRIWGNCFENLFHTWKEDGYCSTYRNADGAVNGQPCHVIDVSALGGKEKYRFYFSTRSGLLLKKKWRSESQEGPVRELLFSDYRTVKNQKDPDKPILFSFRREQLVDGAIATVHLFTALVHNS